MTMGTPDGPHSRFLGFVTIPCTEQSHASWWTENPPPLRLRLRGRGGRCQIRRSDHDRTRNIVPGRPFAIFIQESNGGRNGWIKSWFCQYISIPTKYTVSDSILQYKVGLTLSFLLKLKSNFPGGFGGWRPSTSSYRGRLKSPRCRWQGVGSKWAQMAP